MRVLLTGATGLVGSHVARLLLARGDDVYALLRDATPNASRIDDIGSRLKPIRGTLDLPLHTDPDLERVRPEMCVHLAWDTTPGRYLDSALNPALGLASFELASRLTALGCKRLVAAGTCFEYDTDLGYLSESSATRPRTLYAASKLGLFHVLEQLSAQTGLSFAWPRLFFLYGPTEDPRRLIPTIIRSLLRGETAALTAGDQIRDYLHVEDVASAICAVAHGDVQGAINVGSGNPLSIRQLAETIGDLCHRKELLRFGAFSSRADDPPFVCANNARLRAMGWQPRFDLVAGIENTLKWWQGRRQ